MNCFDWCEGPGPFPGLLDLWGGEGKLLEYRAALLASYGIASLGLDYLTPKITMETGKLMDKQYFEVNFKRYFSNISDTHERQRSRRLVVSKLTV